MRRAAASLLFATLAFAAGPVPASAQTATREPVDFRHATTLGVFGGGSVDGEQAGPAVGGALGWQLSRAVEIQGIGRWFDRGQDSDAFAAALLIQTDLLTRRGASLFASGGLGLYHASFGPAAHAGMPGFYRRRMAERSGPVSMAAFTDPAVVLGGGLKFALTRHVSMRPAFDATVVPQRSRYHVVTTVAISLAYRFERHPVTALRGSN